MALSWTEIKDRALRFANEWKDEASEDAEAKSFWDNFFNVFGVNRRRLAQFEKAVERPGRSKGFVDLFWPGTLVVEHKSRGRSLDDAYSQAVAYFVGLKDHELPRYVLVSDFARFRLYDLEEKSASAVSQTYHEFQLSDLHQHIKEFGFMLGYQKRTYKEEDPVNIKAAQMMGSLHDKLKEVGYDGHTLEVYLVRLLFCLFADDTSIFDRGIFQDYLSQNTREDGFDLGSQMAMLFQILNTPPERRSKNLDEALAQFPYVNGKLFAENLMIPSFDRTMRQILLDCCALDWGRISPAIFGSLFQSVMNPVERRNLGAHYTSEKNILKVIKPLFLDDLWKEFKTVQADKRKLTAFHKKLANLRFLDPACGCGNFLIITYRELRLLEIEVIKALQKGQQVVSVNDLVLVDVDRFCGIEYEEFPAQIAQVALWLMDHQMNMRISEEFGQYYIRLPLTKSATIMHGNALRTDWQSLLPEPKEGEEPLCYNFIIGNPPFLGHHYQSAAQKADMATVFHKVNGAGVLDYVSAWYLKAAQLVQGTATKIAFVSTNSIAQGEQVGLLWGLLFAQYHIKIHFAHRTFKWNNEAKGNAAVHVVIIGFANFDVADKLIYEYDSVGGEPHELKVSNINPYLVDGRDIVLRNRSHPISPVPPMIWGNKPTDGGNFLFDSAVEKDAFLAKEPKAERWIRPFISGEDFIKGRFRYCLWLKDIAPNELNTLPEVKKRVEEVRKMRLASIAEATRRKAGTPTIFAQISQPDSSYLIVPEVSSERRRYIPIAFMTGDVIASNTIQLVPEATLFQFGVMVSIMHMTWTKYVCGRLKSDFRYSNSVVYNNFPWPQTLTEKQVKAVETAAQRVLDVRTSFIGSSMADLYDPLTMPPALVKAHQDLDRAVDLCYRPQAIPNETRRIEYLFELYEQYTAPLMAASGIEGKKKSTKSKVM
ncbi:class I SAM-dependent DNA methyltransferase [Nostoc sp. CHAB 5834]|nr:class I SAM-dependent DNA methyltransferase [Nostoc sp. CHAB 5834]